ncbi:MAG: hypothetical protein KME50_07355 [Nostoc desertorum CM1-VF14]|nr:hypothetical protein [Nostoc desertorum CM1-VF14]
MILDVVIPEISGFELCRFIKTNSTNQQVPLLIFGSKNQAIHRLWTKNQGADAYRTKPNTPDLPLSVI